MAATFVSQAFNSGTASPLNTSIAVTSGNALLAFVYREYDFGSIPTVTSVVWDSAGDNQSFTLVDTQQLQANSRQVDVYRLNTVTSSKTGNVTLTLSGSVSRAGLRIVQVSGHNSSSLLTGSGKSTGIFSASTTYSQSVTSASGDLVVGFIGVREEYTYVLDGSGQSNFDADAVDITSRASGMATKAGSAGSVSISFVAGPSAIGYDYAMIAVSVASASPPTSPTAQAASSIGTTSAQANWTDNSSDETGFKVEWAASPFSSYTAASGSPAAAGATSLVVTGLPSGTTIKFRIAATRSGTDSSWSESPEFTTASGLAGRALLLGVG